MRKVIPFTHGKGKTGQAKTGDERVLIAPTDHYPNAFEHSKEITRNCVNQWQKLYGTENTPNMQKQLLDLLNKVTSHVYECVMPDGEEVIFLNLDMLKGRDFMHLRSIKVDRQEVMV